MKIINHVTKRLIYIFSAAFGNRGILDQQGSDSGGPRNISTSQHRPNLNMLTDWNTWKYQTTRAALTSQERFSFNCFEDLKPKSGHHSESLDLFYFSSLFVLYLSFWPY